MKKTLSVIAALAAVIVAGTAVSAAAITLEDAQKTALDAVGVKEEQVIFKSAGLDNDDGREIYEVDFFIPGEIKYEFDIDANTGAIVEQDIEMWEADDDTEYAALIKDAGIKTDSAAAAAADGGITELQAKMIALKDAGLKADEATFTKCRKDLDDGIEKYEIEIRTAQGTEYEYDIKVSDGTILEKDIDND
ncbi:MAG: PepSY domain-containing protein [Lachnospiraceae bacterium]|nr:PepSY domain-containing protein [Lachnospiraceae bacterium]